jgi:NTE family protein
MANKVGLVLGSGAARGIAHIGVLKVLEENKIPVAFVAGSSIGALVGALYCISGSAHEALELVDKLDKKRAQQLFDWNVPRQGLVAGENIRRFLKGSMNKDFSELKIPLCVVVTDLCEGRETYILSGNVLDAVMASIAIPVLFKPVKDKEEILVDGGLLNPLPADVALKNGCDAIIAVDVEYKTLGRQEIKPTIFNIAMQSLLLSRERQTEMVKRELAGKSNIVLISPDLSNADYLDFSQGKELIPKGEEAARKAMPQIKAMLGMQ